MGFFDMDKASVISNTIKVDWSAEKPGYYRIDKNLLGMIFQFLSDREALGCRRICTSWKCVVEMDAWRKCLVTFGKVIYGRAQCEKLLNVDPGPVGRPSKEKIDRLLNCSDPTKPSILFYMPKGWTLKKLVACANKEVEDQSVRTCKVDVTGLVERELGILGRDVVEEGHWVELERKLLPKTLGEGLECHQKKVKAVKASLPPALEGSTILWAHYRRTGEKLLLVDGKDYGNDMRCEERIDTLYGKKSVCVGFSSWALDVSYYRDAFHSHLGALARR